MSNEVSNKARGIVGQDVLNDPVKALTNLRFALRVCASFRGCYLDKKELAENLLMKNQELIRSTMNIMIYSVLYNKFKGCLEVICRSMFSDPESLHELKCRHYM